MVVQIGELYPIGSRNHAIATSIFGEAEVTEGTMRTNRTRMSDLGACADKHE
jgi:hypothetical protein